MGALLDSLASGFHGNARQRSALDAALRDGLPGPRAESWKYTSLRALERRTFANAPARATIDPAVLAGIPAPRLVFVNGVYAGDLSESGGLADGVELRPLSQSLQGEARETSFLEPRHHRPDEVFARLNAALAVEGALLRIREDVHVGTPIHLVFVGVAGDSDLAWHARHSIELRHGAAATVVEHHLSQGAHANLGTVATQIHLAANSMLRHVRVQEEAPGATLFARTDAVLAGDARYARIDLELGASLSRHELNVRLEGEGASLQADGVLFADGRRHIDTRLGIEHVARETRSSLGWRGLAAERSRAVFHGGIVIRAGADGSEAGLSNRNLLLSEHAEIDTQPVLEIHADEVRAAHGATVGQLDPVALFYLRSRGLGETEARRLLTAAFCREIVAGVEDDVLRARLDAALERSLARLGA